MKPIINSQLLKMLFLILLTLGCQTKQEKFIQSEFDRISGQWQIETFTTIGVEPKTLDNYIKSGKFLFQVCNYDKKQFKDESGTCSMEMELNGILLLSRFRYDYSTKLFYFNNLGFSISPTPAQESVAQKGSQLLAGAWELTVTDNKLFGKQKQNQNGIKGDISFVATRK
jgi:hypothetical protein